MGPVHIYAAYNSELETDSSPSYSEPQVQTTSEEERDGIQEYSSAWEASPEIPTAAATAETEEISSEDAAGTAQEQTAGYEEYAEYRITLELDGGLVNGLELAGWEPISAAGTSWSRAITEETAGAGCQIILDESLGGLLPETPYRAGYRFQGWQLGSEKMEGPMTMTQDTVLQALWEETTVLVSFQNSGAELWTVEVPWGSVLWTDSTTPWLDENVIWQAEENGEAAEVTFLLEGTTERAVHVNRHSAGETERFYYTFSIDNTLYFTYGGPAPQKTGYRFSTWKMCSSGSGFTVEDDAVFTAQFAAEETYVFEIYYRYADGTKAGENQTLTKTKSDVAQGSLSVLVDIPEQAFYTWKLTTGTQGVAVADNVATVAVDTVFGGSLGHTLFLTVVYTPVTIPYQVEYYLQNVEATGYTRVETMTGTASYGSRVAVPSPSSEISLEGFVLCEDSRWALRSGVLLRENPEQVSVPSAQEGATIRIYYDRVSYFVYFQTGTTEVQLEPLRVRYGAEMTLLEAHMETLHRSGYQTVTAEDISWYRLDQDGQLQQMPDRVETGAMPAYDLYAVVNWHAAETSLQIVYWVENKNSAGFQNAYTATVKDVRTDEELTVTVGSRGVTMEGAGLQGGTSLVETGFQELMRQNYGSASYATFFSPSSIDTRSSPGNVASAEETGTGDVRNGTIAGSSFRVRLRGDGTSTVNVYYTRNLYTLEFVLGRRNGFSNVQVAVSTPGSILKTSWSNAVTGSLVLGSFGAGVTETRASGNYGGASVQRVFRLTANSDPRSPVGRYGTRYIQGHICDVYTLTARFEGDISALWPTAANLSLTAGSNRYISMGTDGGSYYRNVVTGKSDQHNILSAYSTMDQAVVAMGTGENSWSAVPDFGNGTVAHQMIAYWASSMYAYSYYFLYQALDATLTPESDGVMKFTPEAADAGTYQEGDLVSYGGQVYCYSCAAVPQNSTHMRSGQNQPARQGFTSVGKTFSGEANAFGGNIYFFYDRQTYALGIQNVNGSYKLPARLLTEAFACLASYGGTTLNTLGWLQRTDGTVMLRYGSPLSPIQEQEIVDWLTGTGGLCYPIATSGESQYSFSGWYQNAQYTAAVDWTDPETGIMTGNQTLYAGWRAPSYVTTYVLNGGRWTDSVEETSQNVVIEGQSLCLFYPHTNTDPDGILYWYAQAEHTGDGIVYQTRVGTLMELDAAGQWCLKAGLTLADFPTDFPQSGGSSLIDRYFCQAEETCSEATYGCIYRRALVNTVLPEPSEPEQSGHIFGGWYWFDGNAEGTVIYLEENLPDGQCVDGYGAGWVYLDNVGDAHLLYADEAGDLFYYESQTGYRFSYANGASVVSGAKNLYAAWIPQGSVTAQVYYLVPRETTGELTRFTGADGGSIPMEDAEIVTIGGTEYVALAEKTLSDLYAGSVQRESAQEYFVDNTGCPWLPIYAELELSLDANTSTVERMADATGNTCRMETDEGAYAYYAWFLYAPAAQTAYHVYAIDLAEAVAQGALENYQDGFVRSAPPDEEASYVLQTVTNAWSVEEPSVISVEAPVLDGYLIYGEGMQTMQLQADSGSNNLYFYYVQDEATVPYTLSFYLMRRGGYADDSRLNISGIPGSRGEQLNLEQLAQTYGELIQQAQTISGYSGSTNEKEKAIYERYRSMTVTLTQNGETKRFTVDAEEVDTLELSQVQDLLEPYYFDGCSLAGESVTLTEGLEVEAYLGLAELRIQKVNSQGRPIQGAQFTLERLRLAGDSEDCGTVISYQDDQYVVDETFPALTGASDRNGKLMFQDLSASMDQGGGTVYRLTETDAPAGYYKMEEPVYLTVPYMTDGVPVYRVRCVVSDAGITYLPQTGGPGDLYRIVLLGGTLCLASVLWGTGRLMGRRRRKPLKYQQPDPKI